MPQVTPANYLYWRDSDTRLMDQGGQLLLWQPRLSSFLEFDQPLADILVRCNGTKSVQDLLDSTQCDSDLQDEVMASIDDLLTEGYLEAADFAMTKPQPVDCQLVDDAFKLKTMIFHVTDKCNLCCKDCYLFAKKVDPNEPIEHPLSTSQVVSSVKQFAALGGIFLDLSGGEPMLRRDLVSIAAAGYQSKLRVCMVTNGTLITQERLAELSPYMHQISVSLDGLADSHEKTRGDNFDQVVERMKIVKKAGLELGVTTVVTTHNRNQLPQLLQLLKDQGVTQWNLTLLRAAGRAKQQIPHDPKAPKRYLDQEIIQLAELLDGDSLDVVIDESLLSPEFREETGMFIKQKDYARWHNTLTVLPDGTVATCVFYPELCYGDITTQSIAEICFSPKREEMIAVSKTSPCDKCPLAIIS